MNTAWQTLISAPKERDRVLGEHVSTREPDLEEASWEVIAEEWGRGGPSPQRVFEEELGWSVEGRAESGLRCGWTRGRARHGGWWRP